MLLLQIFRGALLGGGGLALGNGVALSYGGGHRVVTYVAWYVLAALLLAAGVVFWVEIHRRKEATGLKGQFQDGPPGTGQGSRVYGAAAVGSQPDLADKAMQEIREMFERSERKKRDLVEAELVAIIDEGEGLRGNEFSGNPTLVEFDAWRGPIVDFVGTVFGTTEKQRLLEVKWNGYEVRDHFAAVLDWLRALRDRPDSWRVQIAGEEVEAAITSRRPPPLADALDALMREGAAMFNEFSAPLQPEKVRGGWKLSEKEAPDDWWQRAQGLYDRSWGLLHDEAPGRIKTFVDAFREHLDKAHTREGAKAPADRLSTPKEIRDFFASRHKEPALIVEAILEGLAVVRNEMESAGAKAI